MPKDKLRPGQSAPVSAQYDQLGPRGGFLREVTVPKGKTLPPIPVPGGSYRISDRTKNKSGRK